MSWKRVIFGLLITLLYLGAAGALVYVSYKISPPTSVDEYKEFGVRAGIALTATAAFFSAIFGVFTLSTQLQAAKDLEVKKGEIILSVEQRKNDLQRELESHKQSILLTVEAGKEQLQERLEDYKKTIMLSIEDRKKELQGQIEYLRGSITRQNEFLSRTLDVKSIAYDRLFVASNMCYRELQKLAKGEYDKQRMAEYERSLQEAQGLGANLDDEDRAIVMDIVQAVLNIVDEVEQIDKNAGLRAEQKGESYGGIWNRHVKMFGYAVERLQNRSLFHNQSTKIDK